MSDILLISNCRLGDSLVMIPALKMLRQRYHDAHLCLISEQVGKGIVDAKEILGGRNLVDEFVSLDTDASLLGRLRSRLRLFRNMRKRTWDLGMVMIPPIPPLTQRLVSRLTLYLRACGAKHIIAPARITWNDEKVSLQLARLIQADINENELDFSLPSLSIPPVLPETDIPDGKRLLAVAPGANMPINVWPIVHYEAVLKRLPNDVHPIYFGGENERPLCTELAKRIPGTLFVGHPMAEVETMLRQCACYLGNDTGLMHLAAACGLKCVAVFSQRNKSRAWEPAGNAHIIFRTERLACAGCVARECPLKTSECMMHHNVEAVTNALTGLLASGSHSS